MAMEMSPNPIEMAVIMEPLLFVQDQAEKQTQSLPPLEKTTPSAEHPAAQPAQDAPERVATDGLERDVVFPQLVERCWQRAYWIAFDLVGDAAEAEDLCQDALLRAYEKWGSFREESSIDTWFYRIVTNLSLNRKRRHGIWNRVRQWVRWEREQDAEPIHLPASIHPEKQLRAKEIGEAVLSALEQLPTQQRTVFVLRYLQDFSLREISEITELAEGTVKTHIFRALKAMRSHLAHTR